MSIRDYLQTALAYMFFPIITGILASWFYARRGRPVFGIKIAALVVFGFLAAYWFVTVVGAYVFYIYPWWIPSDFLISGFMVFLALAVLDLVLVVTFGILIALWYKFFPMHRNPVSEQVPSGRS